MGTRCLCQTMLQRMRKRPGRWLGQRLPNKSKVKEDIVTENVEEELAEKLVPLFERDRSEGDGESLPVTPPYEAAIPADVVTPDKSAQDVASNTSTLNIKMDSIAMVLLTTGIF